MVNEILPGNFQIRISSNLKEKNISGLFECPIWISPVRLIPAECAIVLWQPGISGYML
jgi:hypothetical protein